MKRGDWERRFGAARRRSDRRLLEELERQIGLEDGQREALEARARLARVFGRPGLEGGHRAP